MKEERVMDKIKVTEEKRLKAASGMAMLFVSLIVMLLGIPAYVLGGAYVSMDGPASGAVLAVAIIIGVILNCTGFIMLFGLRILQPNEALVLTLFGNYYGTLYDAGFYWVNPFCTAVNPAAKNQESAEKSAAAKSSSININMNVGQSGGSKKVSLKTTTLDNKRQKVNDAQGNPVEIGTIVIWKVKNATKAVLNVENYTEFLSIQCDAITRNAARDYPYDTSGESEEKTLRGSSQEIADIMQTELQNKVTEAGLEILDVRITHLAYAPELPPQCFRDSRRKQ